VPSGQNEVLHAEQTEMLHFVSEPDDQTLPLPETQAPSCDSPMPPFDLLVTPLETQDVDHHVRTVKKQSPVLHNEQQTMKAQNLHPTWWGNSALAADMEVAAIAMFAMVTSPAKKDTFLHKVVHKVSALLPVPTGNDKRRGAAQPVSTLQCSRRIAGAGVEFHLSNLTRSTKKVMRTLNIIGETDGISQQAQDEYAKLFSEPLSASSIKALAILFGWTKLESRGSMDASAALVV
jgi:hypothetical protein